MADEIEEPEVEENDSDIEDSGEDNWDKLEDRVRGVIKDELAGLDIPGMLKKAVGGIKWPNPGVNSSKPQSPETETPARSAKPKNKGILGDWF